MISKYSYSDLANSRSYCPNISTPFSSTNACVDAIRTNMNKICDLNCIILKKYNLKFKVSIMIIFKFDHKFSNCG